MKQRTTRRQLTELTWMLTILACVWLAQIGRVLMVLLQ
jgi:hypothetical protein